MTANKYRVDPRRIDGRKDVVDIITELNQRLRKNENALRIGNTSIENGNLIVRNGDIVVSETNGTESLRIKHGEIPEIRMFPLGPDINRRIAFFGFDFGAGSTALQIGVEKTNPTANDGGRVVLWDQGAALAFSPSGGNESYLRLNILQEVINIRGKWIDMFDIDSRQALSVGSIDVDAGFSGFTWSYGMTMASKMAPVIGLVNTAGLVTSWNLTDMSTSSFTVNWTGTLAKIINFWSYRL